MKIASCKIARPCLKSFEHANLLSPFLVHRVDDKWLAGPAGLAGLAGLVGLAGLACLASLTGFAGLGIPTKQLYIFHLNLLLYVLLKNDWPCLAKGNPGLN